MNPRILPRRLPGPPRVRLLDGGRRFLGALALASVLAGCGSFERRPPRAPHLPPIPYGEVVQEIRLEGIRHTDPRLVLGSLASRVGEPYTPENATRDYLRLLQMEIFTSVYFTTEPVSDGVALTVHAVELGRYSPSLSVGHIPENGWEVGPSFGSPNFMGKGHKASTWFRFGESRSAGVVLKDVWHPAAEWYDCCWDFEYYWLDRYNYLDDFDERSHEVILQYLAGASEQFHIGPRLSYLNIAAEPDSNGAVPAAMLDPDRRDEIPGIGISAEYDSRNFSLYPTSGWYVNTMAEQFGRWMGGPADFKRLTLDTRRYVELAGPVHSLALYSLATFTWGRSGIDIPLHQDFHLGGSNSIRGWENGSRAGKNQWITTVEYWWNLLPRSDFRLGFIRWSAGLQLAAFADVGTAWDDGGEFRDNWIGGGGVGLRLTVPQTGFLKMDLALGQTSPSLGISLHFGTGDKADAQRRRVR